MRNESPCVVAVIPTLNPKEMFIQNLSVTLNQVDAVVVVDDGSTDPRTSALLAEASSRGATVLKQDVNRGIAEALNLGYARAIENGAQYVLTLDQDTALGTGGVHAGLHLLARASAAQVALAAVAPGVVNGSSQAVWREKSGIAVPVEPIQSGLIIDVAAVGAAPPFNQDLFIDAVDTEFFLRQKRAGLTIAVSFAYEIQHSLGREIQATFRSRARDRGSKSRTFPYHSPIRRYYITRNRLRVMGKYWRDDTDWSLLRAKQEIKRLIACLLFGPQRGRQLLGVVFGIVDAAVGRTGEAPRCVKTLLSTLGT